MLNIQTQNLFQFSYKINKKIYVSFEYGQKHLLVRLQSYSPMEFSINIDVETRT